MPAEVAAVAAPLRSTGAAAGSATASSVLPVSPRARRCLPRLATTPGWTAVLVAVALTAAAAAVRLHRLADPASVVFDEVHFGGHAAHYINRTYFFDIHPPLGKMLLAAAGAAAGFDGRFRFSAIGDAFPPDVPYVAMR